MVSVGMLYVLGICFGCCWVYFDIFRFAWALFELFSVVVVVVVGGGGGGGIIVAVAAVVVVVVVVDVDVDVVAIVAVVCSL